MGPTWVMLAPDGPHEPCYQSLYIIVHGHLQEQSCLQSETVLLSLLPCINTLRQRQMAAIFQTMFLNAVSSVKIVVFGLKCH